MPVKVNELAADIHRRMVEDDRFGYSWSERYGATPETWDVDGVPIEVKVGDYDCSSSTITAWRLALRAAGVELGNATYTGNIKPVFLATGLFDWVPVNMARRGDLYLNIANHVAMAQGDYPGPLSEFSSNEHGGCYGGVRGDQTGWEAHTCGYYGYPWDGCVHWVGGIEIMTEKEKEEARMTIEEIKQAIWGFKGKWVNFDGKIAPSKADANQLLNQAGRVWSYRNPKLEKVDAYQILRDIRDGMVRCEALLKDIDKRLG